jgi:biotin transporter BioY
VFVSTLAVAASPSRLRRAWIYRVALALAGSWLIAALAQVQVRLPFTPVSVTGQTLGVLPVAASLGSALGSLSLVPYFAQGALGLAPFVVGDALKLFVAAGALPAAWRVGGGRARAR